MSTKRKVLRSMNLYGLKKMAEAQGLEFRKFPKANGGKTNRKTRRSAMHKINKKYPVS